MFDFECLMTLMLALAMFGFIIFCMAPNFHTQDWTGPGIYVPRYTSADAHCKAEDKWRYGRR